MPHYNGNKCSCEHHQTLYAIADQLCFIARDIEETAGAALHDTKTATNKLMAASMKLQEIVLEISE